jgi:hypothetical protein
MLWHWSNGRQSDIALNFDAVHKVMKMLAWVHFQDRKKQELFYRLRLLISAAKRSATLLASNVFAWSHCSGLSGQIGTRSFVTPSEGDPQ